MSRRQYGSARSLPRLPPGLRGRAGSSQTQAYLPPLPSPPGRKDPNRRGALLAKSPPMATVAPPPAPIGSDAWARTHARINPQL
jgi:hypothetical protein